MVRTERLDSAPGSAVTLAAPEGDVLRSVIVQNDSGSAVYLRPGQTPGVIGAIYRVLPGRVMALPVPNLPYLTALVDPDGAQPKATDWITITASTDPAMAAANAAV